MKEIKTKIKLKAIKLFLGGDTFDEIAQQLGIAKGSVVNIIDDFREGSLPVPPGMAEYVDQLRHLVVDLKKHNTTVSQLKNYVKLHVKLLEMGVDAEETEQWLDICQGITSPTVSNNQFVAAALEMAEVTAVNGLSYKSQVKDYGQKLELGEELDIANQQKKKENIQLKKEYEKNKEQCTGELKAITNAMATAQESFEKQKESLKLQLDEYITQNQLSWAKVNTVAAILNQELGKAGLNQAEKDEVAKQIATAGSLCVLSEQLEQKIEELQPEVSHLAQGKEELAGQVATLNSVGAQLFSSILEKGKEETELDAILQAKRAKLPELDEIVSGYIDDIHNTHLIIGFLGSPEGLSNNDIDELVRLMIFLRQYRLGVGPYEVKDSKGNMICECKVPKLYVNPDKYEIDTDEARKKLALCLEPLVRTEFMPRWAYDAAQVTHSIVELQRKLDDLS